MGNLSHTTGNVGIGTTTPLVPLEVHGGSVRVSTSGAFEQSVAFSSNAGGWARGLFFVDSNASSSVNLGITGGIGMDGSNSSPTSLFLGWGDGPWQTGTTGKGLRILTNGNVGVGTSSPTTKLDVNGSVKVRGVLSVNETSSFTTGAIKCPGIVFTDSSHTGVGIAASSATTGLRYVSPFADYTGGVNYKPTVLRYGKIVVLQGLMSTTAANAANAVAIRGLPVPKYRQEFYSFGVGSNTTVSVFAITKTGELIIYRSSTATATWYSINCAYIAE